MCVSVKVLLSNEKSFDIFVACIFSIIFLQAMSNGFQELSVGGAWEHG
jgi:hypothetical protein